MIFEKWFMHWRLRRATRLIAMSQFDAAQRLLIGILDKQPDEVRLRQVYGALAETEFRRSKFLNARYYAGLFLESYREKPADEIADSEQLLFEKVTWYHEESERARQNFRRKGSLPRAAMNDAVQHSAD
jgi:hypothetical protein